MGDIENVSTVACRAMPGKSQSVDVYFFRLGASRGAGFLSYNGAAGAESVNLFSEPQPPEAYHPRNMSFSPIWAKSRAVQLK